jgi:RNA-directed DNA polymerase
VQPATIVNGAARPTEWNAVNWRRANRQVRNLRQRIYRATQAGERAKVRSLQRLMLRSYANTLVGVRRVTQVNQGRKTAGVDKVVVKTPVARGKLVDHLMTYQPWQAKPARRVHIPKANGTLRPLGIPTVIDRCLQARVKNALEPSWEARFEGSSYGFRPGRGCHDAIAKIYLLATPHRRRKWVVDADITGAFDHIDHDFLLQTIGDVPGKELIRQWLKAGYMENGVFHPTDTGTPQGGVISPLLANIALHGLEDALGVRRDSAGAIRSARAVVRYADDFVVFCESKTDAERVVTILTEWLAIRGLTLSGEKTRIVHLTDGFDFLGFTIRHYPNRSAPTGYKLLITPSRASVAKIITTLRDQWRHLNGANIQAVLRTLGPIVRGWANYFRIGVAKRTFADLEHWMFIRQVRWVNRQHPTKSTTWKRQRYWGMLHPARRDRWVFGDTRTGRYLERFSWFPIERHVLVRGAASPDDATLRAYWVRRDAAKVTDLTPGRQRIARNQRHVCPLCGESIHNGEEIHAHHVIPRQQGGNSRVENLILVHLYCHQQVHRVRAQPA